METILFELIVNNIILANEKDSIDNIAIRLHITYIAKKGDITVQTNGELILSSPDPLTFISSENLTKEIVTSWIKKILLEKTHVFDIPFSIDYDDLTKKEQLEKMLTEKINEKESQPKISFLNFNNLN